MIIICKQAKKKSVKFNKHSNHEVLKIVVIVGSIFIEKKKKTVRR
jgi:hypothetical protein